jgi:hypothetical protein
MDHEPPNLLPVLQVLGVENRAAGPQRRSNDETVVEMISVVTRDLDGRFVEFYGHWLRRVKQCFQNVKDLLDFVPIATVLRRETFTNSLRT